jgi:hypothetical protein
VTSDIITTTPNVESFPLWDALKAGNPALAVAPLGVGESAPTFYSEYPGFEDWLLSELALGWPSKRIVEHLRQIRDEQEEAEERQWPALGKRDIDHQRIARRDKWVPIRERLSTNIENVGVLAKNTRLLTLARTAEELERLMYEERNEKSGELYLFKEWRGLMHQIAEEKGELGEQSGVAEGALVAIAELLTGAMRVQGSGIQSNDVIDGTFSYMEEDAATPVSSEGSGVQENELPPDADSNPVP